MWCKTNIVFWKKKKEYNDLILPLPYPGFSIPKRKQNFIIDIFLLCHLIVNMKRQNQKHFSFIAIRFGQLLKWGLKY